MVFDTSSERLIVSIDLKVERGIRQTPRDQALSHLRHVSDQLKDLEVTIKVNTLARILGCHAVEFIHDQGFPCFLDLKLFDIGNTLENDLAWIEYYQPSVLTVAERIKPAVLKRVQEKLPDTLVLPVGPLTDMEDEDFAYFDEIDRRTAARNFFRRVHRAGSAGAVCAPIDIKSAPPSFREKSIFVTPGVKPSWCAPDNNSANSLTPEKAIAAGAKAIIVGRGIIDAENIGEATKRTLDEMEQAFLLKEAKTGH